MPYANNKDADQPAHPRKSDQHLCFLLPRYRVSRSLKKEQGGHSEKGHMVRVESFEKGTFCARAMRKRQKGYFQYNVEKH